MATSRTGTGQWQRLRAKMIAHAIANGQTRCPICGVAMDWEYSLRPNSPEVDHILPVAQGGTDDPDNLRVICRFDNQSRGGKSGNPKGVKRARRVDFGTADRW